MTITYLRGDNRPTKVDAVASKINEIIDAINSGGGGGITEITSNDESVTVTNPTGPTADLSASGGSQTLCYEVVLDATNYPVAGAVVPLGLLMLEVGDRIVDIGISVEAGTTATDWTFGKSPLNAASLKVSASLVDGNNENDGGPYSTTSTDAPHGLAEVDSYNGQGRLPCTVLEAHELCVAGADGIEAGSVTLSIYVIRAASVSTLTKPSSLPNVTSYTPDTGGEDDPVVIHGSGFTAATDVLFSSEVSADAFTVDSDIQITTAVPAGATTGAVVVEVGDARSGDQPIFTVT